MSNFKCKRCGNCCIDVGRTFWKAGNLDFEKPFGSIEELNKLARNGDHEDNGLPCEMLRFDGLTAVCMIEEKYGYEAKPIACKEHQGDERCNL